jgi:hypothetical protein
MPVKNTKEEKSYNPVVTAFFDAPVFGVDATETTPDQLVTEITTKAGKKYKKELGSAFTSAALTADGFSVIQKNIQIGSRLLLRQSRKLNKNGGRTFFLEVLPADTNASFGGKTTINDDGI